MANKYIKKLCKGYDAERDVSGRAGGSYGHNLADMIIEQKEIEKYEKSIELEKMAVFLKRSNDIGLNHERIFDNREDKEKLIKDYGYSNLSYQGQFYNKDGPGISLTECNDAKIGWAFKNLYESFKKQLGK
jgi:hypothetical protein